MRRPVALLLLVMTALAASPARANGRFPTANHLVFSPTDPSRVLLRATFGFALSTDRGANWDWVCERAVGYGGFQDPAVALTGSGAIIAGVTAGLASAPDGCRWAFAPAPLLEQYFVDVAIRRAEPATVIAISSRLSEQNSTGETTYENHLVTSSDEGTSWSALGQTPDPTLKLETIDGSESDPRRLYISAVRNPLMRPAGVLLVSTNAGRTWVERPVPLELPNERAPFIAAVDPTDANRVYIRTSGTSTNRLLVTTDAGRTFRVLYSTEDQLLGFALSPDGSKIYFGGLKDGLRTAPRGALVSEKRSDLPILCLAASGSELWACSIMSAGFIVGASVDDGATFSGRLKLDGMRGPLACGPGTSGAACAAEWPALRELLATGKSAGALGPDASTPQDGGAAPATPIPPESPSPPSRVATGRIALAILAFALIAAVVCHRIRRGQSRDTPR